MPTIIYAATDLNSAEAKRLIGIYGSRAVHHVTTIRDGFIRRNNVDGALSSDQVLREVIRLTDL